MDDLKHFIRNVPDFPKKGIGFKDITTLLKAGSAFSKAVDDLVEHFKGKNVEVVVGVEARGFIFGAAIAYNLGIGFIPVRKPGKLPAETIKQAYELEYGTDAVEIHKDAIQPCQNVLIVDDLLATGGTVAATAQLIEKLRGNIVGIGFLIELDFLKGREKLSGYEVFSLVHFDSE
ncbi:adenine phosphoribosyltransferase [candidate division KSB1 bacterium]|nr:adenine phosphoribosyltransferase [candidate division KSB1 bacterium]